MREFISSAGILIKLGENAKENDRLVKSSHQDFFWVHLENLPSGHAVIESPDPDPATINEAMQAVKYFSKARGNTEARMITAKIREVERVDRTRPGLVQLKKAPTKRVARTDHQALRRMGLAQD
jgi:predicted ribosome quality control (RQC) complex YloA/Tae2 family protein